MKNTHFHPTAGRIEDTPFQYGATRFSQPVGVIVVQDPEKFASVQISTLAATRVVVKGIKRSKRGFESCIFFFFEERTLKIFFCWAVSIVGGVKNGEAARAGGISLFYTPLAEGDLYI